MFGVPNTCSSNPGMTDLDGGALVSPSPVRSVRTMITAVAEVVDVHPHLRRITFAGGDLATFCPARAGHVPLRAAATARPGRADDRRRLHVGGVGAMPTDDRPVGAYYTLREWRPESAELDMLFVLHDPAGRGGEWARGPTRRPGGAWGPRETFNPPPATIATS